MNEAVKVSGAEDKASAELEWIFAELELSMPGGFRSLARCRIVFAEEMKQGRGAQADSLIRVTFVVDKKREVDLSVVAKLPRISNVTQSDRGESSASFLERCLVFAQLRDVLAAEDSAVVTKKHNHGWTLRPQTAQSHRIAVHVRKRDAGQLAAIRLRHG